MTVPYLNQVYEVDRDQALADEIASVAEELLSVIPTDPDAITDDVRRAMDYGADRLEELGRRIEVG